jgi:alpha-glucan,water dikinase
MKTATEKFALGKGLQLRIEKKRAANRLRLTFTLEAGRDCLLHWGLCRQRNAPWQLPSPKDWPPETKPVGNDALQTAFRVRGEEGQVTIDLPADNDFSSLTFVLFSPGDNYWDNNHGQNYAIRLPRNDESLLTADQALDMETAGKEIVRKQIFNLAHDRRLATAVLKEENSFHIILLADIPGRLILHWGIAKNNRFEWLPPSQPLRPAGTEMVDERAAQTLFTNTEGFNRLHLVWQEKEAVSGIAFVLYQPDSGQWLHAAQGNLYLPVRVPDRKAHGLESAQLADVADEIVAREMGRNSWTLMHRFNLCHDLLDRVGNDLHGLALLFVWLRFSAIRQLDWQRNYNTKPRELSHAQMRLTEKLAALYRDSDPAAREVVRLLLTTVGRGGEGGRGQRIRDEILEIMHRHKIKEVSGHFMEEWHQKIHNNATADDIVICEAYLGFLHSNGDLPLFYRILANSGVTRKRLEGFERPIVTPPDFVPHLKEGLIYDFERYLKLLKSVHSATDLFSALEAAAHCLDNRLRDQVAAIYYGRDDQQIGVRERVAAITEARRSLHSRLGGDTSDRCVRDLLYLDLALEDFVRVAVERQIHQEIGLEQQVALIGLVIENVLFSHADNELTSCLKHWQRLRAVSDFDRDWALHARAVLDRVALALGVFIDYYNALLQPKAETLGKSFAAEPWTVELFTQEVVRGCAAYVLSILLRHISPLLRKAVDLGDWQIISQNDAVGWVESALLLDVQARQYERPTVLITEKVTGDEDPGRCGRRNNPIRDRYPLPCVGAGQKRRHSLRDLL